MTTCFKFHNNYINCFDIIKDIAKLRSDVNSWETKDVGYFETSYYNGEIHVIIDKYAGFRLKSEKDASLMRKLAYHYLPSEDRFVFFELLDAIDLNEALTVNGNILLGEDQRRGIRQHLFSDNRFLNADFYGRSGELYICKSDYEALNT